MDQTLSARSTKGSWGIRCITPIWPLHLLTIAKAPWNSWAINNTWTCRAFSVSPSCIPRQADNLYCGVLNHWPKDVLFESAKTVVRLARKQSTIDLFRWVYCCLFKYSSRPEKLQARKSERREFLHTSAFLVPLCNPNVSAVSFRPFLMFPVEPDHGDLCLRRNHHETSSATSSSPSSACITVRRRLACVQWSVDHKSSL
jgi:hypothetical protein